MKTYKFILCILFLSSPVFISGQSIGIIGTATSIGNWSTDVDMIQHSGNPNLWTLAITLSNGEVKFRQDDSWTINWGGTTFPSGTGIPDGPGILVTTGNYMVSFNTNSLIYNFDSISSGNVGIGTLTPSEMLDVDGNIKFSGELKPNGVEGDNGQVLQSKGDGSMQWTDGSSLHGSVGYGTWGDCEMTNITEYNPVADPEGEFGDAFGCSVSISGDYAIVGAYGDDEAAGASQGSARIIHYNSSSGLWELDTLKLMNPGAQSGDWFGYSVGISGDYVIVGAPKDDSTAGANQGSASVFKRNGSTGVWELQGTKLLNPGAMNSDEFGTSVSISGDYAIVGVPKDDLDQGSASIFKRNEATGYWVLEGSKLTDPGGSSGEYFGYSVSISGDYAIVGIPEDDVAGNKRGAVCIYEWNESTTVWELHGKYYNDLSEDWEYFGRSVSISGDYAIVGANGYNSSQGRAKIFKRDESTGNWETHGFHLMNPSANTGQRFGLGVAISGDHAVVGASYEAGNIGDEQGSVCLFLNIGPGWQPYQKIFDPGGNVGDRYGHSIAIDNNTGRFVVGSRSAWNITGKVVFGKY